MTTLSRDLYTEVTDRIIAALEAGTAPWVCPWRGVGVDARPANATASRPYRGVNVVLLNLRSMACGFGSNRWLTFQQAASLGAHVRRGEQGTQIVFFKLHEIGQAGHDGGCPHASRAAASSTTWARPA